MASSAELVSDNKEIKASDILLNQANEKCLIKQGIVQKRETWKNTTESFLSMLSYVVGIGNLWRFPYLTYANGGGAFLVPYLIFMCVCGFPMFFMETSLGQHSRGGAIQIWNKVPIMKGIGIGGFVLNLYSTLYYILVTVWGIFYFVHCFTTEKLPWDRCDNWWNTKNCLTYHNYFSNKSANISTIALNQERSKIMISTEEFWNYYAMRKSSGIDDMGTLENWQMLVCLVAAWIIVYFCIFKGIKSSGKVVYFTATFPYVILVILLVQGCLLDGAKEGIIYFLKPDLTKLQEPQVWVQAGSQVCYTLALCYTIVVAFGSYNDYHMDCYKHSIMVTASCALTSFLAGFSVFAILGHLAHTLKLDIAEVASSGPELVFLTYPVALSLLGPSQLWNGLFFALIILIGIDSQFCGVEGLLTIIYDNWEMARNHKEIFSFVLCLVNLLLGMIFMLNGGIYVFELMNNYAGNGITLLLLVMMESIAIGWLYGVDKLYDDVKDMIGYYPSRYIKICIRYITPTLTLSILVYFIVRYTPLKLGSYVYPPWANGVGFILCFSSSLCVPIYAAWYLIRSQGSLIERLKLGITESNSTVTNQSSDGKDNQEERKTIYKPNTHTSML